MKITEKTFNALTGEETITERDETPDEIKAREDRAKELDLLANEQAQKNAARQVVLDKLGLTFDDLLALGL